MNSRIQPVDVKGQATAAEIGTTSTPASRQSGATHKTCVKCSQRKELNAFPIHSKETGERGSYCRDCKNALSKERRQTDAGARLRHYIVTRIKNELQHIPADIHTNLEHYLGYRLFELKKHLRQELKAREGISLVKSFRLGHHLDHISPHSSFNISTVYEQSFKDCWAISNLRMISGKENLQKGAKLDFYDDSEDSHDDDDSSE
jgi:hypothetical protein